MSIKRPIRATISALGVAALVMPMAAQGQYQQEISNDASKCNSGPSVRVTVTNIKSATGTVRVQLYRGTKEDWLVSGRWLKRIEVRAQAGTMTFCLPAPQAGTYAIAVRHDANDNGRTDLTIDGGAMSNNPSINIFNLGKPSYTRTAFTIGNQPESISIRMRYM